MRESREALAYPTIGPVIESSQIPWIDFAYLHPDAFQPTAADLALYGQYGIAGQRVLDKPHDVPGDQIAYNPSAIWTVRDRTGQAHDILYARVEPDSSRPDVSHLGKSIVRPYTIDLHHLDQPLQPFADGRDLPGEDPAFTRINRRLPVSGNIEPVWLVSAVVAEPDPDYANKVKSFHTDFYVGSDLHSLEKVAEGPEGMKDIRLALADPHDTQLEVYGRPQPDPKSGNISHLTINDISELSAAKIDSAQLIDDGLLPYGSGLKGGVNDIIPLGEGKYILAAHRAYDIGEERKGRHYEALLYGHDTHKGRIVELGVVATANMFPTIQAKDDELNLSDVVFTGGTYNGRLEYLTFGLSDSRIAIAGMYRLFQSLKHDQGRITQSGILLHD